MSAITAVTGNFTGTGNGNVFTPKDSAYQNSTKFNFAVWGTFVGTIVLEKSYDGGATYIQAYDAGGNALSYTAPRTIIVEEPEDGVKYRPRCSAFTSGTINYRLSR